MADELTPPRKLDRAALDRVLQRAAELQSSSIEGGDSSGALTEAEIIELGKEAGMSPEHLRQAIAEERTRSAAPDDRGIAASVIGPATVRASRIVQGTPRELLEVVDAWMQRQECLKIKRRVADRIVWEARNDIVGNIQRGLKLGGNEYALSRAAEVSATVTSVDANRTLITLDAGLAEYRGRLGTTTGVAAGMGAGASVIGVVLGVFLPVAVIPAIVLGPAAWAMSRKAQLRAVDRGQLALEQLLDHLERGDHRRPGGLLAAVTAAAAKALQSPRV
jgi:hypothetical protein